MIFPLAAMIPQRNTMRMNKKKQSPLRMIIYIGILLFLAIGTLLLSSLGMGNGENASVFYLSVSSEGDRKTAHHAVSSDPDKSTVSPDLRSDSCVSANSSEQEDTHNLSAPTFKEKKETYETLLSLNAEKIESISKELETALFDLEKFRDTIRAVPPDAIPRIKEQLEQKVMEQESLIVSLQEKLDSLRAEENRLKEQFETLLKSIYEP